MKSYILKTSALICGLLTWAGASAQLDITTDDVSAMNFATNLAGSGVTVVSAELVCPDGASGFFENGETTNIGISSGILLTTGAAADAGGPSTSGSTTTDWGADGDIDLDDLVNPFSTFDACYLEFTFIPDGDEVEFTYVFSSEEYNEYVCSIFNDVFAFFASGPGLNNVNLALLPDSDIPVTINTVNNGSIGSNGSLANCSEDDLGNSDFFVENIGGTSIEYDGFTVPLSASLAVTPGEEYTFKLAIADVGDGTFDSGVFIASQSLTSEVCEVSGGVLTADPAAGLCNLGAGGASEVNLTVDDNAGENSVFLLTDTAGIIIATAADGNFDLEEITENWTESTYVFWHLAYNGEVLGLETGENAQDISGICFDLSNPVQLAPFFAEAGEIFTFDSLNVCLDEQTGIDIITTDEDLGFDQNTTWIITDPALTIVDTESTPPFIFAEAGSFSVWKLAFSGNVEGLEVGANAGAISGTCFDLSNPIEVTVEDCLPQGCQVDGGVISTTSPLSFCKSDEEAPNLFVIDLEGASGENSLYIGAWQNGNIFMTSESNTFDLSGVPGNGICLFYHLSYDGEISGVENGSNVSNIEGACFDLSNGIEVQEYFANAGTISTTDSTELCAEDFSSVSVSVSGLGGANGQTSGWIVTDENLIITSISGSPTFVFDQAGEFLIWRIGFVGEIDGIEIGADAGAISGTCFDLSNAIGVSVENCEVPACNADGGVLTTDADPAFCNTEAGPVDISAEEDPTAAGQSILWLITDADGTVLASDLEPPFVFAEAGTYLVWRLGYFGELSGTDPGNSASEIQGDCFDLSDPFEFTSVQCPGIPAFSNCIGFETYYTGYPENGSDNKLYNVYIEDGNADFIEISGFSTADNHIAVTKDNLIYAVRGSNIDIFDPVTGEYLLESIPIVNESGQSLSQFPSAVTDGNDDLWLARSANNTIYKVTFTETQAIAVPRFTGLPVSGGDLVFTETQFSGEILWLANRTTNTLYNVTQGGSITLPLTEINGVSVMEDGKLLFANGAAGAAGGLYVYDPEAEVLDQLTISDGPSAFFNGDLAGGCINIPYLPLQGECYATEVVEYIEGSNINGGFIPSERTDPGQALGAPEGTDALVFVSLGYGGSLTLSFNGIIPNGPGYDLEVLETSFGTPGCASYPEYADVYVSTDGESFLYAGTVCKSEPFIDISEASPVMGYANYVKILNNDGMTGTFDAFDIDGVVALHNCEGEEDSAPGMEQVAWTEPHGILSSYPNPGPGISNVTFTVRNSGKAVLEVFDSSGRNIQTIYSGDAEAELEYRFQFNGEHLPNGLYVYKLTTDRETVIHKFLLAR
ncbi:MAG: choice-of-anchor L domain-containing protein [Cryomorphaceae bacterium]|nr:T9SS type A sorting domain-containing protein [Flavobacteriales bacterium]